MINYFHYKLNYFIRYGCPSMDEIESYSRQYKKRLDEVGASGEIPDDLALEVTYFKFLIAASILPRRVHSYFTLCEIPVFYGF